jgi:uncharacterized membrane protein YoaK (UPF0700 family)
MFHPSPTPIAIRNALLLLLACAAGYVDALSYIALGRVFTANMTGNTALLGIALVGGEGQAVIQSGLALAGFLVGAALSAWIVNRGQTDVVWPPAVTVALVLEGAILIAFAVGWRFASDSSPMPSARAVLIALSAVAMGVQSAAARRLDVSGIATTYITGTLTSLVTHVAGSLRGAGVIVPKRKPSGPANHMRPTGSAHGAGLLATVWLVYVGGAIVATGAISRSQVFASVFPVAVIMVVIATAAISFREREKGSDTFS